MPNKRGRIAILLLGAALIFIAVVIIGLHVLPAPHSETDFMVIGSIATFVSLGAVFFALIKVWVKSPDTFYKRKAKPDEKES